jgi:hypothetical protein
MSMEDRQKTFENKFAHDEAMLFKVEARTCKLFGLWVAEQIGEVVAANLEEVGYNDVIRKVRPDIDAKGLDLSDHLLNTKLDEYEAIAKEQLMSEVS